MLVFKLEDLWKRHTNDGKNETVSMGKKAISVIFEHFTDTSKKRLLEPALLYAEKEKSSKNKTVCVDMKHQRPAFPFDKWVKLTWNTVSKMREGGLWLRFL